MCGIYSVAKRTLATSETPKTGTLTVLSKTKLLWNEQVACGTEFAFQAELSDTCYRMQMLYGNLNAPPKLSVCWWQFVVDKF